MSADRTSYSVPFRPDRAWYRLPFWRSGLWALLLACAMAAETIIGLDDPEPWSPAWLRVAGITPIVIGLVRCSLGGVYTSSWGVRVLNPFWTHRVPWSDIERFRLRDWGPFPELITAVDKRDGDSIRVWMIGRVNPLSERVKEGELHTGAKVVKALNDRLGVERAADSA